MWNCGTFLTFTCKQSLTFRLNCLQRQLFEWNVKFCFLRMQYNASWKIITILVDPVYPNIKCGFPGCLQWEGHYNESPVYIKFRKREMFHKEKLWKYWKVSTEILILQLIKSKDPLFLIWPIAFAVHKMFAVAGL